MLPKPYRRCQMRSCVFVLCVCRTGNHPFSARKRATETSTFGSLPSRRRTCSSLCGAIKASGRVFIRLSALLVLSTT